VVNTWWRGSQGRIWAIEALSLPSKRRRLVMDTVGAPLTRGGNALEVVSESYRVGHAVGVPSARGGDVPKVVYRPLPRRESCWSAVDA
jgi:hypothetical protein